MEIWHIWAIVGFVFLIVEMFAPTTFFLTLAGASFFAGIAAFLRPDIMAVQVAAFVIFVPIFYFAIKPVMDKKDKAPQLTGMDAKYIGKTAVVSKPIGLKDKNGIGEIKIYGEVWQAKACDDTEIETGAIVEIVSNESLIMFVKKCEK